MTTVAGELVVLNEELVRRLATVIRYQEADLINTIRFQSELERAQYLLESASNYSTILSLLDDAAALRDRFLKDEDRRPICAVIFDYVVYSCNDALQTVRNYTLRKEYLEKLLAHVGALIKGVVDLDTTDVAYVALLANEARLSRDITFEYLKQYNSVKSRNFSKWLKDSNLQFEDVVKRYQAELGYTGLFENLEDEQKLEVYEEIIEVSGRGKISTEKFTGVFKKLGIAVNILKAGSIVWDIYTAEQTLGEGTRDAIELAASIGGAMLGELVGAALATKLVGAQASTLFVTMAGIVGGIVGGFVIGLAAGALVALIFGSGGSAPISTDGFRCYVAEMPDGARLARQLSHQNN